MQNNPMASGADHKVYNIQAGRLYHFGKVEKVSRLSKNPDYERDYEEDYDYFNFI